MNERKFKKWTEDEEDYLRHYLADTEVIGYKEASEFLGRSVESIRNKAWLMRKYEELPKLHKDWTEKRTKFLIKYYPAREAKWIARYIGMTTNAVNNKARELKLRKSSSPRQFARIEPLAKQGLTRKEIAAQIGITYRSVEEYIRKNKIPCKEGDKTVYFRELNEMHYAEMKAKHG